MALDVKVVRLYRFSGEGATKAMCDISLADEFLVKGLRIVEGKKGLFVSMPRQAGKDGKWYDSAGPLTDGMRETLSEAVLSAYKENGSSQEA